MRYTFAHLASGEAGTDTTVQVLADLVNKALQRPLVRAKAIQILNAAQVPNNAKRAAAEAIYNWVKNNVRYLQDPVDIETVQDPEATLKLKAGDCDDHTALVAALAQAIGIPARFRVIGHNRDRFEHIFPELLINAIWTPADTTTKHRLGQRPPQFAAEKIYSHKGVKIMPTWPAVTYPPLPGTMPRITGPGITGTVTPVTHADVARAVYPAVWNTLKRNWNGALINRADLVSYLRVIDEGNAPSRGTPLEPPMRKAIADFLNEVDSKKLVAAKPSGVLSGLEGLDGFLSSVLNAAKKAVGGLVKVVTGGGTTQVNVPPVTVQLPESLIQTKVTPEAAQAGVADLLKSPVVLIGLALLAFMAFRK